MREKANEWEWEMGENAIGTSKRQARDEHSVVVAGSTSEQDRLTDSRVGSVCGAESC